MGPVNRASIWKNALCCLTCMNKQTHCFVLLIKIKKWTYQSLSMLLCTCSSVLAFCESFITVVFERLTRKCWHYISLFTVTSNLAQWFVNRLCSFFFGSSSWSAVRFWFFFSSWGGGTAPQTPPLLLNILAFFIETHPKQSQHDVSLQMYYLSLIHIWRCRRSTLCRSRWSPYH